MAEKITNGAFASDLSGWTGSGFSWASGKARAISRPAGASPLTSYLTQAFSVSGQVVSADLDVRGYWSAPGDYIDGSVRFIIQLTDPDAVTTTLVDTTKDGPSSGNEMLADEMDISEYLTSVGSYTLRIEARCASARTEEQPWEFEQSTADYDDVSLLVVEKMTKMVAEELGGGETNDASSILGDADGVALTESLDHEGGGEEAVRSERLGARESFGRFITKAVAEALGALSGLARTYGFANAPLPGELVGLAESAVAEVRAGDLIRTIRIGAGTVWTPIPGVSTTWAREE